MIDPIIVSAGSALVGAMAVDGWQQTRDVMATWWRQHHTAEAGAITTDLDVLRDRIMAAREEADSSSEAALVEDWSRRLQQLVLQDPAMKADVLRLLNVDLAREPGRDIDGQERPVVMKATAHDSSRVFLAGRDQHITGS